MSTNDNENPNARTGRSPSLPIAMRRAGFTLMEMMTVIGIIVLLTGATAIGYSKMAARARRVNTQELVSNTATALTMIFQDDKIWPKPIRDGNSGHKLTADVCAAFVRHGTGLLGLSYKKEKDSDGVERRVIDSSSADRCGLLDPHGQAVMRRKSGANESTPVPSGGTIDDHILRFAVDLDGDGITELPGGRRVRATACVWSFGADGKEGRSRDRSDDVFSWNVSQEVK